MGRRERNLNYRREVENSMRDTPILEFEYFEQIIKLRNLERESAIKKAQIGAAAEGRLDRYEDAAWENARLEEFKTTRQVMDLKHQLSKFRIIEIDETRKPETIKVGTLVKLRNMTENLEETFLIAGTSGDGRISTETPLAKQLIGKQEHQTVEVVIADGSMKYKILEIRWGVKEYLDNYLPKYVQREIPHIKEVNAKVALEDPTVLRVPYGGSRQDLVEVLQKKSYLTEVADKIEYIIAMVRRYSLIMPEQELSQYRLVLDKIKRCFDQAKISYTSPF
jgi:transcription elongation factor GreA